MRFLLAFRVFFRVLFSAPVADKVRQALDAPHLPAPAKQVEPVVSKTKESPAPKKSARSEALTLLAALQREARFVDLVQEPLSEYSDAQIGAAARDVLRDCGKLLSRMFAIEAIATEDEGAGVTIPSDFSTGRFRLTGKVGSTPPYQGKLVHHGWQATRCEVPAWTGDDASASVIAPVEVEIS